MSRDWAFDRRMIDLENRKRDEDYLMQEEISRTLATRERQRVGLNHEELLRKYLLWVKRRLRPRSQPFLPVGADLFDENELATLRRLAGEDER